MEQVYHFKAMGGPCEVRLVVPPGQGLDFSDLCQAAEQETRRIETKFSRYRDDSVLSQINRLAGREWVSCDEETLGLLNYSAQLFEVSDGLFDITSGVLRRVWDFKVARCPDDQALGQVLPLIGFDKVLRKGPRVQLALAGMELDFGGIGKEYAVDRVAALLREKGVRHGLLNFAGDVHVIGPQPDGRPWMMAVQHPREPGRLLAMLPVAQGAMTTSGDYERFFEQDGQRHCHILNPITGCSARYWQSVTVLAPLASAAGAYCTMAMLQDQSAIDFLNQTGCPYLAVDAKGRLWKHDDVS